MAVIQKWYIEKKENKHLNNDNNQSLIIMTTNGNNMYVEITSILYN